MTEKTVLNERKMPNYIDQKNESVQEVAQDVLERAKKYGYKPDEDMVRGSVEESANLLNIVLTEAQIVEACQQVMTPREVPQHEITVHDFEGRPSGEVYDLTQTDDSIKDGDVINLGNGNVAILMNAWPTVVVGEIEHFHRLVSGVTFESIDGGKYAASAAKALEVSNSIEPSMTANSFESIRLRVFGSRASSTNRPDSDIDVLLEGRPDEVDRVKQLLTYLSVEEGGPLDLFVIGKADNEIDLIAAYSDTGDPRVVGVGDQDDLDEILSGSYDISPKGLMTFCEEVEPAWSARSSSKRDRDESNGFNL